VAPNAFIVAHRIFDIQIDRANALGFVLAHVLKLSDPARVFTFGGDPL
jgi:hypothetical protein